MTVSSNVLTLRFKLLSAATFGRGDGLPGLVDVEVEHDEFGLPYLRGRTLRGLLAEEMEALFYAIAGGGKGKWSKAKDRLLGISGRMLDEAGILHVGDATLPGAIRNLIAASIRKEHDSGADARNRPTATEILEALTAIRRQTAMTPLGAPEPASLRALRVILRGVEFEAQLTFDEDPQPVELALLAATVSAWRRGGTGRNRGRGYLKAWLEDKDWMEEHLELFRNELLDESHPEDTGAALLSTLDSTSPPDSPLAVDTGPLRVLQYTLELKQPVLATDIMGEPNSAISLDCLPGSLLRGAITNRYLQRKHLREFDALGDYEARSLFITEQTRYLNAYPIRNDKRALPVPLSWVFEKSDDWKENERYIYNLAWTSQEGFVEQSVGAPFAWHDSSGAILYDPPRQLNVHNRRNARLGRATEDSGDIFRYEALAAGTFWRGVILTTADRLDVLKALLEDATLWIGRSRRAGYGEARIVKNSVVVLDYWRETEADESAAAVEAGEEFSVILTADTLLRDELGQAALDPCAAIERALELPEHTLHLVPSFSFVKTKIVGGFNRKWGLPLSQLLALAAGSVFTCKTSQSISSEQFETLELKGIGERRGEGFGSLLINWPSPGVADIERMRARREPASLAAPVEQLNGTESSLVDTIAERLLRQRLDKELVERVNRTHLKPPIPHKNQLSRLRLLLRDMVKGKQPNEVIDLVRLHQYVRRIRGRRVGEQLERARVESGDSQAPLIDWIENQLKNPQTDWSNVAVILGQPVHPEAGLAQRYALQFIDSVLYRAAGLTGDTQ